MARQNDQEVAMCLDAATGKEIWRDQYPTQTITGGPGGVHAGPRSSPAFSDGRVVMVGTTNIVSCYDTEGKLQWRKDDFKGSNLRFFTASSPIIADGMVICALGNNQNGGIVAYDLNNGDQKWKWTGDGPGYSSPVLASIEGAKQIVMLTDKKVVGVSTSDGALLLEYSFPVQGRGYNTATPVVDDSIVYISGANRGTKALQISKEGEKFVVKELWSNPEVAVGFSTPVLKDGHLYAVTGQGAFFCIDAKTGKTRWTAGSGRQGYGAMLDAGSVILALTQKSQLSVIQPNAEAYTELAAIKVAEKDTFAHPVLSGNRMFVRDTESLALYTVE
jgi:outer membrane protein assembly factor BamB